MFFYCLKVEFCFLSRDLCFIFRVRALAVAVATWGVSLGPNVTMAALFEWFELFVGFLRLILELLRRVVTVLFLMCSR